MRHADGHWVWVLSRGKVTERDAEGRPLRACGTHLDISDRKLAEEERTRLETQLRQAQKMEAIGQLAGGIAHDFNNLLQVINGYCGTGAGRPRGRPRSRAGPVAEIAKAGNRAADLVVQAARLQPPPGPVPGGRRPQRHGQRPAAHARPRAGRADRDPASCRRPTCRPIAADRGMVEQVLMNLCVNARDAMPDGGLLTIETRTT